MVTMTWQSAHNTLSANLQTITRSYSVTPQFHKESSKTLQCPPPKSLCNIPEDTPVDSIKKRIDKLLKQIPDEPRIPGYYPTNNSASNRLEDQIQAMGAPLRGTPLRSTLGTGPSKKNLVRRYCFR